MKLLTIFSICIFEIYGQDALQGSTPGLLKISLFFEGDCPDCHVYFREQLIKAWEGPLIKSIQTVLELVPFGNAEQSFEDGRWKFNCQHGPKECLHNKLHACAIQQACGEGGTSGCDRSKLDQVIRYIMCVSQESDQMEATVQCSSNLADLTSEYISQCARSEQGSRLLSLHGNRTAAFTPAIDYVPYVAVNEEHDVPAEDNLVARIYELKPDLNNGTDTKTA